MAGSGSATPLVQADLVGPEVTGADKYLAGEALGQSVYGLPLDARRVLRIDGTTGAGELVGPDMEGQMKYACAIAVGNRIYGIPYSARRVLRVDGDTGAVDFLGPELPGAEKYASAVRLGERIYAMPCRAQRALRLDCSTDKVDLVGPKLPENVRKYGKAVAVVDGTIYAFPWSAGRILRMDGATEAFDFIGPEVEGVLCYAFAASVGQHVYALPCSAKRVLHVNHGTGECRFIGPEMDGGWKCLTGGVVGKRVYGLPRDAKRVVRIDGATGDVDLIGPEFKDNSQYTTAAVVGTSVYGIPCSASKILRLDDATGVVDFCGPDFPGSLKYSQQTATVLNGSIFAFPFNAARALRVRLPPTIAESPPALLPPASSTPMDAERAINRWGVEIGNVLTGTFTFFQKGFVPEHTAAECLAHISFEGQPGVLRKATEATASEPNETRGYVMLIYAYTLESPLYTRVTACMRTTDEKLLSNWREYIYHMEKALNRQPCFGGTAFRGIDVLVPRTVYEPGTKITWQSFSSATRKVLVLLKFLKVTDIIKLSGTVFVIKACNARCIRDISAFPLEDEVVFGPNTHFKVDDMIKDEAGKRAHLPELEDYDLTHLKVFTLREL